MPSWNVHIAHADRLLEKGAGYLGVDIHYPDAFLLGNVAPDVHIGFMVPDYSHKVRYGRSHQSYPGSLPIPSYKRYQRNFMDGLNPAEYLLQTVFIQPNVSYCSAEQRSLVDQRQLREFIVGIWCHLVCDHVYNTHTRAFLRAHHIPTGEDARIRKQADFDVYGRSLDMNRLPEASDELFAVAAAHPQYGFTHSDVEQTLQVIQRIAEENRQNSVSSPQYQMLDTEFFSSAYKEAEETLVQGFMLQKHN